MDWLHKKAFWMSLASIVDIVLKGVPPLNLESSVVNGLKYVKAYGGLLQSGVPSGYTAVEYIESTGTQYIDTGISITSGNFQIDADMQFTSTTGTQYSGIFGGGYFGIIYNYFTSGGITTSKSADTQRHKFIFSSIIGTNVLLNLSIDGTNYNLSRNVSAGRINFLSLVDNSGTLVGATKAKLYSAQIYDNGTLVRDFIPAKRNSDSVIGMYDAVSNTFFTNAGTGTFTAGNEIVPTPSDPIDLVCNNGALKILDKSDWTIFTNPTSIAGQGVWIDTTGMWKAVDDNGAGVAIPLTIGKQYTLVVHKKTAGLGTILRYGQSPQATPTAAGIQLTDWYRGEITDGQIVSFVAKQPYLVMQFSAVAVESGMVQEAIEVLEAQGTGYTFVDYIKSDGSAYIDTGISPTANTVAEVVCQCNSDAGNKNIFGSAISTSAGASKQAVFVMSSYNNTEFESKVFETTADTTFLRFNGDITQKNTLSVSGNGNIKLNGVVMATQTATPLPNNKPIWLFTRWRPTASAINGTVAIYGFKVWENDVLVQDLIPAIRNSDNVVGMYDTVSGTFFTNAGTGTFVAGTPLGDGEVLKLTPSNDTAGVANLLKINNYVDTQEILTGLINHQLGIYVFDGTENFEIATAINCYSLTNTLGTGNFADRTIMCSHFASTPTMPGTDDRQGLAFIVNKGQEYTIAFGATTQFSTQALWQQFLANQYTAGTPVIVVYPLATAQDEVAPVPQTMQTVAGDNTLDIVQSGMTGLEVEVKYTRG